MTLNDALNQIIDDGIEAARHDYSKPCDTLKREGSIFGFEECRGKNPDEISALLRAADDKLIEARAQHSPHYWYWRCRQVEIEWVANVLSCMMAAQGWTPIATMTVRGHLKAAEIIGVKSS